MPVDVERRGGTAVVTVNGPHALNALDHAHAEALREHHRFTGR